MLQAIEIIILELAKAYFQLSPYVSVFTIGVLCSVLFIVQWYKQKETLVPGFLGVFTGAIVAYHVFWPQKAIAFIEGILTLIYTPQNSRQAIPFFEFFFARLVAPYPYRSVIEEVFFVALVVYGASVAYWAMKDAKLGVATSGGVLSLLGGKSKRPKRSESNELGSGDFATSEQIAKWLKPSGKKADTMLNAEDIRGSNGTSFKRASLFIPPEERNRHLLIVAKTGSGKTTKFILPILYNDCLDPFRSTIVIDSKPEMWRKLAAMTRKYNPEKEIILFNPLDTLRSLSWNILSKIETDTDAKLIANTIVMATDNPTARQDSPFFRNNALQVLNAIMVGLLFDKNDRLSMPRIHELVQSGNKQLCSWLEAHPMAIRTTRTFVDLVKSGSQNADTIMSELSMRLAAWDLKAIRSSTFYDELDLELLIQKPTLFIVELRESELEMLRPLANVIVTEILRFLTKRAEQCPGSSLPRPVGLVIDEFASALGRVPDIHVKLNTLRSRNVSIVAAVQSLAQINANYGDDADSVIAGFSTKIFMPSLDVTDAEWASKESGQMTVRFETNSTGSNKKLIEVFASKNDSKQEQVQQRPVLTPDEIGRPVDNITTFFFPNTPVFQGFLIPHYKIPEMLKRINEFDAEDRELKLRSSPIEVDEKVPEAGSVVAAPAAGGVEPLKPGISDTRGWDDAKIRAKLEEVKAKLAWDQTTGSARKWWLAFENENIHRLALVLRLAEELLTRAATITEFFLAYVYSNTDNIQANLFYLDYTRLKREDEKKKRDEADQKAKDGTDKAKSADPAPPSATPAVTSVSGNSNSPIDAIPAQTQNKNTGSMAA